MSSAQKLSPLLVQAKDSYVAQIADILAPFVVNVVNTLYMTAKNESSMNKPTKRFQEKLREIPQWNQSMIDAQLTAVMNKHSYFPELVAAAFVSYVKILSSVKISAQKPKIQLKLPADDVFMHKVFVNSAKSFYLDPALVKSPRDVRLALVRNAVETSIRDLLPIEQILKAYLGGSVDAEGLHTDIIDEEEIDLSPEEDEVGTAQERPESVSASLSSVQALGDQMLSPSPAAGPMPIPVLPETQQQQVAVDQLRHLLQQTSPAPIPLGQTQALPQQYQQQPQVISVPRTSYPGAFVSPAPRQLHEDAAGDEFFQ
jgi:hypothetical protein